MPDFTLDTYRSLCRTLAESGYKPITFGEYYESESHDGEARVFLRHDVDSRVPSALDLAAIEQECGLRATYFFRLVKSAFVPDVIKRIAEMGMEVGYHYEALDRAKGDYELALKIVEEDLSRLRELAPVKSMAMHGNPLTPYNNRDLWKEHDYHEFGIEVSAYLSLDYQKIRYFTDTGRNWDETRGNLYDTVSHSTGVRLTSTKSLIAYLREEVADTCILTHPNRWSSNPFFWCWNLGYDLTGNVVKGILKIVRR
jgi:hypothetical protein